MSRTLAGTPPQIIERGADPSLAYAWIENHYDDLRGQWVAVSIEAPKLVASASTLKDLWKAAPKDSLRHCLIHYVSSVEDESHPQGTFWSI